LDEEKKKYDGLLDEKLELDEKLRLAGIDTDKLKDKLLGQEQVLGVLKGEIDKRIQVTDDLNAKVEEEKKINKIEEERFRKLA
jgi:hypothetical protein